MAHAYLFNGNILFPTPNSAGRDPIRIPRTGSQGIWTNPPCIVLQVIFLSFSPFPGLIMNVDQPSFTLLITYNVASESVLSVHVPKIIRTILSVTFQQLLGWVPYLWTALPSTSFHAHPVSHKTGFCAPPDDSPVKYCILISMLPDVCVGKHA